MTVLYRNNCIKLRTSTLDLYTNNNFRAFSERVTEQETKRFEIIVKKREKNSKWNHCERCTDSKGCVCCRFCSGRHLGIWSIWESVRERKMKKEEEITWTRSCTRTLHCLWHKGRNGAESQLSNIDVICLQSMVECWTNICYMKMLER